MSVELAPLRGGAGAIDSSAYPVVPPPPSSSLRDRDVIINGATPPSLLVRPVLRRTLQFAAVIGGVVLLAAVLAALSPSSAAAGTRRGRPADAADTSSSCSWPLAPLSYSLLLRLEDGAALAGTADRVRAHSTAVLSVQEGENCMLLHASDALAIERVVAAAAASAAGAAADDDAAPIAWQDLGCLCGSDPGCASRDCGSGVIWRPPGIRDDVIAVRLPPARGPSSGRRLAAATPPTTTKTVRLRFTYTAVIGNSTVQSGLWRSPLQTPPLLSTQLEPQGARRLLPLVDAPGQKAMFSVAVALPPEEEEEEREDGSRGTARWSALSNGIARLEGGRGRMAWLDQATGEEVGAGSAAAATAGAPSRARLVAFSPTPVMSPYLLAVAAGELECTRAAVVAEAGGARVRVCAARGRAAAVEASGGEGGDSASAVLAPALSMATAALAHYSRLTGLPYGGAVFPPAAAEAESGNSTTTTTSKLDVLLAPGKGGAMENLGLPIFDEARLMLPPRSGGRGGGGSGGGAWALWRAADVLCHEIAHQWAGNLVTAHGWRDLAVNEGAATLLEYGCVPEALVAASLEGEGAATAAVAPSSSSSPSNRRDWPARLAVAAATLFVAPPAVPGLSPGVHEGAWSKAREADASPLAAPLLLPRAAEGSSAQQGEEGPDADFGAVTYSKGAALLGMLSALAEGGAAAAAAGGAAAAALPSSSSSSLPPFARALANYLRAHAFGTISLRDVAVDDLLLPWAPAPLGGRGRGRRRTRRRRLRGDDDDEEEEEEEEQEEDDDDDNSSAAEAFFRAWAELPGRPLVGVSVEPSPSSALRVRQARLCAWGLAGEPGEEARRLLDRAEAASGPRLALECPSRQQRWWLALSAGPVGVGGGGGNAAPERQWLMVPAGEEEEEEAAGGGALVSPAPAFAAATTKAWSLHADGGLSSLYRSHHCDAKARAAVRAAAAADAPLAAAALDAAAQAAAGDAASAAATEEAARAAVSRLTRAAVLLRDAADVALSPPSLVPAWARRADDDSGAEALAAALSAAGAAVASASSPTPTLGAGLAAYSLLAGVALPVLRELDAQVWHDGACRQALRRAARLSLAPSVAAAIAAAADEPSTAPLTHLLPRMLAGSLLADAALLWRDEGAARKLCASLAVAERSNSSSSGVASSSLGPDARAAALAVAMAAPPGCEQPPPMLRPALEAQAREAAAPLLSAEALFALAAGGAAAAPSALNRTLELALGLGNSNGGDASAFASARAPRSYASDLVVASAAAWASALPPAAAPTPTLGPALAFALDRWPEVRASLGDDDESWALLVRLARAPGGCAPTREGTAALARALRGALSRSSPASSSFPLERVREVLGAQASRAEWAEAHGKGLCAAAVAAAEAAAGDG